jgi:nicotinate-nucleotide adenylyltransferase
MNMRIGCLFGTFDPPHNGHVALAQHMLKSCGLDQVWLVVTPLNPFKTDRKLSPDEHRLAMTRLAVQGKDGLVASGFEIDLPKPNYTVDSLRFMRRRWPDHTFALIIGSDNLAGFDRWKEAEDIIEHHELLVYPRDGFQAHLAGSGFPGHPRVRIVADAPMLPVSSTEVRRRLRIWEPVDALLPPTVLTYIRQHQLYNP